jgi:oxygen-independent coproporphyrinogen-3 oxidase
MPGIYLHVPFCKQACHYCNFHFSTSLQQKDAMVDAILLDLEHQKNYLNGAELTSIYFGGGTPSLLSQQDLERIFSQIYTLHKVATGAEITLETNPDDLSLEKLQELKNTPVNRLSIGIQSFAEVDLQFMNRAHNASEARTSIENALKVGFDNLTVDLIYGSPTTSDEQWAENLATIFNYPIAHLSAYCLTVEAKTALDHFVRQGKAPAVDEEQAARQFQYLLDRTREQGFEHYEISNFAKPGWYARHNSSYWLGDHYLGVGPAAHSFNGKSRQWNIANNSKYIQIFQENKDRDGLFELEILTPDQRYNEYVMTSLRTIWGTDLAKIPDGYQTHFLSKIKPYLLQDQVQQTGHIFQLTDTGKLLADRIAMELFAE